jgi:hypothetical protein
MNEPHENLDPDPFANDAARRPSRLRRAIVRRARHGAYGLCVGKTGDGSVRPFARRQVRSCPRADRNPLR